MLKFEEYLSDFTNTINIVDFIVGLLTAAVLSTILKYFYVRYAHSVSNREKFAALFVPLSLTTMLVISVVQASIALSLGLVGALSIVRFRAAIKEPEELVYLFLAIGIGLVAGANKPILAVLAIVVILPLIYLNSIFKSKHTHAKDRMSLNVRSQVFDISTLTSLIEQSLPYVELKRMDEGTDGLFASLMIKATEVKQLNDLTRVLKEKDPNVHISIIDQPDLVL